MSVIWAFLITIFQRFRFLKQLDGGLLAALFFLFGASLLTLAGVGMRNGSAVLVLRQSLWVLLGTLAFVVIAAIDYRLLRGARLFIFGLYLAGIAALAGLLFLGTQVRGVVGWFRIGSISIGPVEFVKIILIILLAQYFSLRHIESYRVRHILVSAAYTIGYAALIFRQPDMGSVIIIIGIWFGVVLISGMRLRQFVALTLVAALLFTLGWAFLFKDYQKERIISFVSRGYDPQGAGYNVRQALVAIGNGGLWGRGVAGGTQVQLYFLPEAETDFIFAAIGEYFGLIGLLFTLASIGYILFWCFDTARRAQNNFSRLTAVGMFFLIFVQSGIHIGMNLGLLPVTGVPLPFVSYGGSNLLAMMIGLGIVQSIAIRNALRIADEPTVLA